MPKRFTATEKWVDPWFCSLTDNEKLFWVYLLDNCNHAGIWEPNWFMFSVYVKNFVFNAEKFKGRILEVGKKWYIPKFVEFQYGILQPGNRAHDSVIAILEKEGASKGLARGLLAPMDMDMVKDKEQEKIHKDKVKSFIKPTIEQVQIYCQERNNSVNPLKWLSYYEANGWKVGRNPMKDWKAAIRTWEHNSFNSNGSAHEPTLLEIDIANSKRREAEARGKGSL